MAENKNWVDNNKADNIVRLVQQSILAGTSDKKSIQTMMDLISGVERYSISDHRRQGIVKRVFDSENSRFRSNKNFASSNFSIDIDDVISTFWESVFKYVTRASATGATVPVRVVNGQPSSVVELVGGLSFTNRGTNCNPIHYLRKMGIMGVRNLINATYRRGLMQICDDCGESTAATKIEIKDSCCPQCSNINISVYWPNGSSSYGTKKQNKCQQCLHTWSRKFAYACAKCKSTNTKIESRFDLSDEAADNVASYEMSADEAISREQMIRELDNVLKEIYDFLPKDPEDPTRKSRTMEIFDILVNAKSIQQEKWLAKDICQKCIFNAPKICVMKCGHPNCIHEKQPDPKISCAATSFDLSKCINFSKKIGEYHGVSASLTARRVGKIRACFIRYIKNNRDIDVCDSIYILLEQHNLLSQY